MVKIDLQKITMKQVGKTAIESLLEHHATQRKLRDKFELNAAIDHYEQLVTRRETFHQLSRGGITTMSEYLHFAKPERLPPRWLTADLLDGLVEVRGNIHEKIKKALEKIADLLYEKMRPEVDRMAAQRDEQEKKDKE